MRWVDKRYVFFSSQRGTVRLFDDISLQGGKTLSLGGTTTFSNAHLIVIFRKNSVSSARRIVASITKA